MMTKTNWKYSLETEAERVLHCAHQMVTGFYRANNFHVLPLKHPLASVKTVSFPDLPYNKIPRFWNIARKTDVLNLPMKTDRKVVNALVSLLEKEKIEKPNYTNLVKPWEKAEKNVLSEIERIIPGKKGKIDSIKIYPTSFGTSSSFNKVTKYPAKVIMYLRQDQDIYTLTEALLSAITRDDVFKELKGIWNESELLVDWLITKSSISKVLERYQPDKKFIPTLTKTRTQQSAKLLKESDRFYKKLGVPITEKVFKPNGKSPIINGKAAENLTLKETELLNFFIKNQNKVISFDKLADIIFSDYDDFSLWAITKTIERLRNKLEENGVSGSYIQTLRGQGYLLKN